MKAGVFSKSSFDLVLSTDFRLWAHDTMGSALGCDRWCWDHYIEEGETVVYFARRADAIRFKLEWL
jgi:hypothetical protein